MTEKNLKRPDLTSEITESDKNFNLRPKSLDQFIGQNHIKSNLKTYIESGLKKFSTFYKQAGITSIAFPQLGSQLGGLSWEHDVQPLMVSYLKNLDLKVEIYEFDNNADDKLYINLRDILKTFSLSDYKNNLNMSSVVAKRVDEALDIHIKSMSDFEHVKGLGKETLKKIYLLAKEDTDNFLKPEQQPLFKD